MRSAFYGLFGFAWLTTGFAPPQQGVLACHGSFGTFSRGQLVAMPSELDFIVDWAAPWVATDSGRPGRITRLDTAALVFDVDYGDYLANYHINRLDGSISQASSAGGLFRGDCDLRPIAPKF